MLGKVLRLKNSKSLSVQKIAFLKLRKKWKISLKKNKESLLTCFWDWVAQNALLAAYSWVYLIKVGLVHSSTRIKVLARHNKGCVSLRAHQNNGPSFSPWLRWLDPVFLGGIPSYFEARWYPTFTFIVSLTHRMDNI